MVFLTTTRRSVANYDDCVDSFTEVTLGSSSNKWYPVLNWFETVNIRTWFHLRQHILTTYEVHYNSRLAACFTILLLVSSWTWFVVVYAFTYPNRQRPTADGWIFQVSMVCFPILVELLRIFDHAASVNEFSQSHRALLAQIQVALDEELMLVGARTVNKNPALQQALLTTMTQTSASQSTGSSAAAAAAKIQGLSNVTIANRNNDFQFILDSKLLLDDVHFAVQHHLAPLRPFGLTVNRHLVQYIVITLIINIVGTAMVLAGFVLNPSRWHV
ncbi:transmembrane protein, putative [Bodo saltans]|uniref:Transmembrane protein, putative n=1 Tax=Bodo saltans TaxID=75058 RepID=A0A0S4JV51_BODSA|nr:transmembrane protein, putative [Bodo saltans]|eukprot:CUG94181.1 transmembrane protein, putative [Bodo saltans]